MKLPLILNIAKFADTIWAVKASDTIQNASTDLVESRVYGVYYLGSSFGI